MGKPVKLQTIIDSLASPEEDKLAFLNKETGEVLSIEVNEYIEEEDAASEEHANHIPQAFDTPAFANWQQEIDMQAIDLLENEGDCVRLPSGYEIDDFLIAEQFCEAQTDTSLRAELTAMVHSDGGAWKFQEKIAQCGLEAAWHAFYQQAVKQFVEAWCKDNDIEYV